MHHSGHDAVFAFLHESARALPGKFMRDESPESCARARARSAGSAQRENR
jgi:hypothetical protein